MGELLALNWEDVDFECNVIHIRRSIVKQRIGPPKTEASQKADPTKYRIGKSASALEDENTLQSTPRLGVCQSSHERYATLLA